MQEDNLDDLADLSPQAFPFQFQGKSYVLREASEDAAVRWRNAQLAATKLEDGKVSGVDGMADTEPLLVSLCVYEQLYDAQGSPTDTKPVQKPTIRLWPAKVVKRLFEKIKEVSDLTEKEDKAALEKRLTETCVKLAELSESESDINEWRGWMHGETDKACDAALKDARKGGKESPAKNGPPATPDISA